MSLARLSRITSGDVLPSTPEGAGTSRMLAGARSPDNEAVWVDLHNRYAGDALARTGEGLKPLTIR
jgi:hypothetical protein